MNSCDENIEALDVFYKIINLVLCLIQHILEALQVYISICQGYHRNYYVHQHILEVCCVLEDDYVIYKL